MPSQLPLEDSYVGAHRSSCVDDRNEKNDFYVYQHVDQSGEIVYVGKGRHSRAWFSSDRKSEHKQFMLDRLPDLIVLFVVKGVSSKEALKIEHELIHRLNPKFNYHHTPENRERIKLQVKPDQHMKMVTWNKLNPRPPKKVSTPDGVFNSLHAACKHYGIGYYTGKSRAQRNQQGWSYYAKPSH